jgi:hypothetical protein
MKNRGLYESQTEIMFRLISNGLTHLVDADSVGAYNVYGCYFLSVSLTFSFAVTFIVCYYNY